MVPRSDLQVVAYGTGAGNMGLTLKQFKRLGLKSWDELAAAKRTLWCNVISHLFLLALGPVKYVEPGCMSFNMYPKKQQWEV